MKKILIVIIFTFSSFHIFANDTLSFKYVDSTTYSMYQKQQWKQLITLGNNAIYNNIDYFYLRMRIGIAYFELKEFNASISHFEKALEFNSASETAMEYKYFALIFSANNRGAGYYAKTFTKNLKDKIKPELPKKIDKVIIESGFNIVPGFDTLKTIIKPPDQKNYRLEKDLSGKFKFAEIALNHEFNKKVSFFHSFSFVKAEGFQQLFYNYNKVNETNYTLNMMQYYLAPTFYGKKNNATTLFGNIIYLSSKKFDYNYLHLASPPSSMNPPVYIYQLPLELKTISSWQYVIGFNYLKNYKNGLIDFTATYSKLNSYNQIQLTTGYGFYANKQKTIFAKTNVTIFSQKPNIKLIFNQIIKIKVVKNVWVDLFGSYGNLRNYNENNGYTILNTSDETLYRIGSKLSIPITKKLSIFLSYTFSGKNLPFNYLYFNGNQRGTGESFSTTIQNNKYNQHLIYVGIIWKF